MADEDVAQEPTLPAGRRPSRMGTTIGSADGLHLPGILPEPDVIEADDELTEADKAILADLDESMAQEDHADDDDAVADPDAAKAAPGGTPSEPGDTTDVASAGVESIALARQRAQLPWWYTVVFFGAGTLFLPGGLWILPRNPVLGFAFAVIGLFCVASITMAYRNRKRRTLG